MTKRPLTLESSTRVAGRLLHPAERSGRAAIRIAGPLFAVALFLCSNGRANAAELDQQFTEATNALTAGEYAKSILVFEALADRGVTHPDASFNRGLAYIARVRSGAGKAGDLGRAAAAFEEAILLRGGDDAAEKALEAIRGEVTRQRSRRAKDAVDVRPTLDRLAVGLASERTWSWLSIGASVLLAIGLFLRLRPRGAAHVTGSVLAPVAALALCAFVPATLMARHLRKNTRAAVVVVSEVYLTDENGRSLGTVALPEAALVEAGARTGPSRAVRWGPHEGYVPASSLRILQRPD